jgi:hypothetical protein
MAKFLSNEKIKWSQLINLLALNAAKMFRCGIEKARLMLVCVWFNFWQRYQQRRRQSRLDCETGMQNPQVPLRLRTLYGQRMSHTHESNSFLRVCVCAPTTESTHTHSLQIYPRRGAAPRKLDFTLDVCAAGEQ